MPGTCSRCSAPCYNKPGPTSVYSSKIARQRAIIRRVDMNHKNQKTWSSPFHTSYQQPNASDIPIFKTWRTFTRNERKGGFCFGK